MNTFEWFFISSDQMLLINIQVFGLFFFWGGAYSGLQKN